MKTEKKIPYRHGILGYSGNAIHKFVVSDGFVRNTEEILLSIASGRFNYTFTIPANTNIVRDGLHGTLVAFINHTTMWLTFQVVPEQLSDIYKLEFEPTPQIGQMIYNISKPRGYVWTGKSWCPKDFICLASIGSSIDPIAPVSQLSALGYNTRMYGSGRSYTPKLNKLGEFCYTVEDGEVHVLEDTQQQYTDVLPLVISDGFIVDGEISLYDPLYITQEGKLAKCTSQTPSQCIGLAGEDTPDGEILFDIIKSGSVKSVDWSFKPNEPVYIDSNGNLTQHIDLTTIKNVKHIGVAVSTIQFNMQLANTVCINES